MQIARNEIVGLLSSLGFDNAKTWGPEKLASRAIQIPVKIKPDEVEEEYQPLYNRLAKIKKGVRVEVVAKVDPNSNDEPEVRLIDTETPADETPRKKVLDEKTRIKELEARLKEMESKLASKSNGRSVAEMDEELEEAVLVDLRPNKKTKAAKPEPKPKERKDSVASKVNGALRKKWKTTEEIASDAGLPLVKVRNPLYALVKQGKVRHRKLVQWRFVSEDEANDPQAHLRDDTEN